MFRNYGGISYNIIITYMYNDIEGLDSLRSHEDIHKIITIYSIHYYRI